MATPCRGWDQEQAAPNGRSGGRGAEGEGGRLYGGTRPAPSRPEEGLGKPGSAAPS